MPRCFASSPSEWSSRGFAVTTSVILRRAAERGGGPCNGAENWDWPPARCM
ncbi:hypothetical protein [Streptosporangium sp. NPDC048865]|uniref:hypothetical protein n=1 Tax=Streptosporangium sp. NPDC048865 TaxID=3155766 RepID=UPI00341236C4